MKPLPSPLRRVASLIAVSGSLCTAVTAHAADHAEHAVGASDDDGGRAAAAEAKRRQAERATWRARALEQAARDEADDQKRRAIEDAAADERACAEALAPPAREDAELADAGPTSPGRKPRKKASSGWYGWQVLIVDGASAASLFVSPAVGLAGYGLGGPIVHLAHRRLDNAAASLGTRLLLPPAAAFVAGSVFGGGSTRGELAGLPALAGGALGVVTAVALDAALYARTTPKPDVDAERPRATAFTAGVAPRREGGVDLGVGVTF